MISLPTGDAKLQAGNIKVTMPSNEEIQSKEVNDIKDNEDEKSGWWSN